MRAIRTKSQAPDEISSLDRKFVVQCYLELSVDDLIVNCHASFDVNSNSHFDRIPTEINSEALSRLQWQPIPCSERDLVHKFLLPVNHCFSKNSLNIDTN